MRQLFLIGTMFALVLNPAYLIARDRQILDFVSDHKPSQKSQSGSLRKEETEAFSVLRQYLEKQRESTEETSKKWVEAILKAVGAQDPEKVRKAIEEFLIDDQMFLNPDQEREAFGKLLKEFSESDRNELVIRLTKGQKEVREKLLMEVAKKLQDSPNAGVKAVGAALQDIKKDHLEAYDRVVKELKAGTIDTTTTHCFSCGEGDPIGQDGYTFGGAMREAASRVVAAFAEHKAPVAEQTKPAPQPTATSAPGPTPKPAPKPVPDRTPSFSAVETATRKAIESPVMTGLRASGPHRVAFEKHLEILKADNSLSEDTLRKFLKSGYYGDTQSSYRAQIDRLSRDQLLKAVQLFMNGEGKYNHCPSCNLGGAQRLWQVTR